MHFGKFRRAFGIIGAVAVGGGDPRPPQPPRWRRGDAAHARRPRPRPEPGGRRHLQTTDGNKQVTITAGPAQKASDFKDDPALRTTADTIQQISSGPTARRPRAIAGPTARTRRRQARCRRRAHRPGPRRRPVPQGDHRDGGQGRRQEDRRRRPTARPPTSRSCARWAASGNPPRPRLENCAPHPPAKREMLKGAIGRLVRPVAISSAIKAPTPGPSWKPWPQKPNWW